MEMASIDPMRRPGMFLPGMKQAEYIPLSNFDMLLIHLECYHQVEYANTIPSFICIVLSCTKGIASEHSI